MNFSIYFLESQYLKLNVALKLSDFGINPQGAFAIVVPFLVAHQCSFPGNLACRASPD